MNRLGPRSNEDETLRPKVDAATRATWPEPWVQLKYFSYAPAVYPRMIGEVSRKAKAGDLVTVYDKNGERFGAGYWNPRARVPLRVIHHGPAPFGETDLLASLERAVALRRQILNLDETGDTWRVISSDGDSLSGLTVDKYADILSIDVHSLGVWQRLPQWLPVLHAAAGTSRQVIRVDPEIAHIESIRLPAPDPTEPKRVKVREHGVRYEVDFEQGHKTGFFCDQRDNRLRLSKLVKDRTVLDLCCYTGGFAISAKHAGGAKEVTAVDLDEKAVEQAKRNANINQCRGIDWVHTDAFTYCRTMERNAAKWEVVILDPPKFIHSRDDGGEGARKYEDLNGLALKLVEPGGLFVTCSCSGLIGMEEFEHHVIRAAHRQGRKLQFFDRTGASPDHPVLSNCPESRYLKVLWARVW